MSMSCNICHHKEITNIQIKYKESFMIITNSDLYLNFNTIVPHTYTHTHICMRAHTHMPVHYPVTHGPTFVNWKMEILCEFMQS
jgi:hypothetical protein